LVCWLWVGWRRGLKERCRKIPPMTVSLSWTGHPPLAWQGLELG